MNKLYIILLATTSLVAFNLEKYEELYKDCVFLSSQITFFNKDKDKSVKINLPLFLENYLAWKATEESQSLLKDLKNSAMQVENIILRKK